MAAPRLEITATRVLSYALAHNRVPVVSRVAVSDAGRSVPGASLPLWSGTPRVPSVRRSSSSSTSTPARQAAPIQVLAAKQGDRDAAVRRLGRWFRRGWL